MASSARAGGMAAARRRALVRVAYYGLELPHVGLVASYGSESPHMDLSCLIWV